MTNNPFNYFDLPDSFSYFIPDFWGVYLKIKPALCGNAKIKDLDKIKKICDKNKLIFGVSNYFFYIDQKTFYKVKTHDYDIDNYAQVFIARDVKSMDTIKNNYFEKIVESGELVLKSENEIRDCGRALGYPDCCIEHLIKCDFHSNLFNAIYDAYRRSKKINYLLNNLTPRFYFIPYFPCSYDCQKSLVYAKKISKVIKKFEPERYRRTVLELKSLYLSINYNVGIIFFGKILKDEIIYSSFLAVGPVEATFFKALESGNKCCISEKYVKVKKDDEIIVSINKNRKDTYFLINFQ